MEPNDALGQGVGQDECGDPCRTLRERLGDWVFEESPPLLASMALLSLGLAYLLYDLYSSDLISLSVWRILTLASLAMVLGCEMGQVDQGRVIAFDGANMWISNGNSHTVSKR